MILHTDWVVVAVISDSVYVSPEHTPRRCRQGRAHPGIGLLLPASLGACFMVERVRRRVLPRSVTAGEHECLLDQIIETGTVISHNVKDTVAMVEPGVVHEEMIFKFGTGEGGSGKEYDAMVEFLSKAFRGES